MESLDYYELAIIVAGRHHESHDLCLGSYRDIYKHFGTVMLSARDDDYNGDGYVLLFNGVQYGCLCFGWGSCSGCDALQACKTVKELASLIEDLHNSVMWFPSVGEALHWFEHHDWKGDYSWHSYQCKIFVKDATAMLSYLVTQGDIIE